MARAGRTLCGHYLAGRCSVFKSLAWKFLYGLVVTVLGVAAGYVNANPDPQSWAIAGLLGGLSIAVVAFVKKFAMSAFLGGGD